MEPLFTHPLTMAAGAALVSAPVIIHLINRMRFRRVRWAAMEFLLKAQKRMRRKLILEQLILLLLRCLLVFLVGLLLARFKWFSPLEHQDARATVHVVVLDDTPSMGDVEGKGDQRTAFDQATAIVGQKIAPAAAQSNTPQSIYLLRVSEPRRPATPEEAERRKARHEERKTRGDETEEDREPDVPNTTDFDRLNTAEVDRLKAHLAELQPSTVRASLVRALRTARAVLDDKADRDTLRVVHLVSDFRAVDWSEEGEALKETIGALSQVGVRVHLIDTAQPSRRRSDRVPRASDNVAIVEFRPLTRVAARDQPVDFEIRVKNYGSAEIPTLALWFYLNGTPNVITSRNIDNLGPGEERREMVQVAFSRVATPEKPLDRFNVVTVAMATPESGGLPADNHRHAVVEVRPRQKVLVLEGNKGTAENSTAADGYYLRKLFTGPLEGIEWVDGFPVDLEMKDLRQFSCVYLLNVREVTAEQAKKLEEYVRDGGGVAFFMGPAVNAESYNTVLYRDGQGVFPAKLLDKPSPLPTPQEAIDLLRKRSQVFTKWILVREPAAKQHPAVAGLYTNDRGQGVREDEVETFFRLVKIDRYWPVDRLAGWTRDPNVRELYCMANENPIKVYESPARALVQRIEAELGKPKFQRYRPLFLEDRPVPGDPKKTQAAVLRRIELAVAGRNPFTGEQEEVHAALLARFLDEVLRDPLTLGDADEAPLREFWKEADPQLRTDAYRFRDQVKFGDPLYLAKQFGHGRVATMLTTAGEQWTDWPAGFAGPSWVPVMFEMYKYLSAGRPVENRTCGQPLSMTFDAGRAPKGAAPTVSRFRLTPDPTRPEKTGEIPVTVTDFEARPVEVQGGTAAHTFTDTRVPGVYVFAFPALTGKDGTDPAGQGENYDCTAVAVNVDADREGQLQRASYDDVVQQAPGAGDENERIHSPDNSAWVETLKQERDDLSTRRWLYLVILLVLIAEQAMAVRLSHHAKAADLEAHAPTAAAVFAHGTPVTPAAAAAPPEEAAVS